MRFPHTEGDKLNSVLAAIKSKFLLETFWDDNFIERYKHLWERKIFYNNCPHINVKIDNDVYSLVNVYAPNDVNETIIFFKELTNFIGSKNTIMA